MSDIAVARGMRARLLPTLLGVLLLALAVGLWWRGSSYYGLGLEERVVHEDYRVLGPSGLVGHGYGIVGTALIVLNLAYLVRRRLAKLPLGSMRAWLDVHVFTGLAGGLLVLFHSAFQARTPIAMTSAISLVVVVVTGAIGRWLHALAPGGEAAELDEQLRGLDALVPGSGERVRRALAALPPTRLAADAPLLSAVATLPRWLAEAGARRRATRDVIRELASGASLDPGERALVTRIERRASHLAARGASSAGASALLRTWRGVHRLLAILMLLTVPVHIGVAWLYGYRWIWSE